MPLCRLPERLRWAQAGTPPAPVLLQVVGKSVARRSAGQGPGVSLGGARADASQGSKSAMDEHGHVGECLVQPVVGQIVIVVVVEVVLHGLFEEADRQMHRGAETPRAYGDIEQGSGRMASAVS